MSFFTMPEWSMRVHAGAPRMRLQSRILVFALAASALAVGLYGRFAGIATWPLGVDEFYISRSIDNVLRTGLPAFPCGGYYNRGLTFQYLVAALRLIGWSPEFAGRFVAAVSSLAVLPAAFLLAKRVQGVLAGWLVVIILCLSVWEIEMARFARMYAPFQAVFAWYLVAYVRYTVDRHVPALRTLAILSVVGVLTWEGGVLLGLANLVAVLSLHERGRLDAADWRRLGAFGLLLILLYLATRDLRGFADAPTAPAVVTEPSLAVRTAAAWLGPLWRHPSWGIGLLLPLGFLGLSLPWLASHRHRWFTFAGLCVVLAATVGHAFLLSGAVLVVLLLMRLVERDDLSWRSARYFWLTGAASAVFWLAVELRGGGMSTVLPTLLGFPDVYDHVLRPLARTVPVLSLELSVALALSCWHALASEPPRDSVSVLLSIALVLVLAVGAIPTERVETRYLFFLYPCLIVLAVGALLRVTQHRSWAVRAPWALLGLPLLCFAATDDFQPRHIAAVDSPEINYRVGMSAVRADHYYPKNDMRSVGAWLASRVQPGDVVITGVPSLDLYYPGFDYLFLDATDSRYDAYVCHDGRTDRWTNHPVAYTEESLTPLIASGHRVYASLYSAGEQHLRAYAAKVGWSVTPVWKARFGGADVILVQSGPKPASAR